MIDLPVSVQSSPQMRIFRKTLPMQVRLQEVVRALGNTGQLRCLCVGDNWGAIGYYLKKRGGDWSFVLTDPAAVETVEPLIDGKPALVEKGALPFKNKTFDAVVLAGGLESVDDDGSLVEDCHRVLKANGRFVICVPHRKSWSPLYGLQRLLGQSWDRRGLARQGYSETDLFRILKDGFDVVHMRTFSRFFVEMTEVVLRSITGKVVTREDAELVQRACAVGNLFYRLAFQFDLLLFLSRGFHIIAVAKRRAWLPRKTPVLSDGRSISEAVLSRPAD